MRYTFVKPDGTLGQSQDFPGAAPAIAANKGRWLPDTPPSYDPLVYTIAPVMPVPANATSIGYTQTIRPAADVLADKLAQLAALRFQKETAGIVVGGVSIKTDRESQALINGAYNSLKNGLLSSIDWKGANGWVTVTLAQLDPIAQAVASHVQACFTRERQHNDAIQLVVNNQVQVSAYDITTGWPA